MSTGDSYLSRRANLYEPFLFNLYLERYQYWRDRDVQIINLYNVRPLTQGVMKEVNPIQFNQVVEELKDYLKLSQSYKILLFPNQFSAYYTLFFSILDLNDEILTPAPIPYFLKQYAESLGLKLLYIETSMIDDFDIPHRKEVESKITPRAKLFYYSAPGFAGGIIYPQETLERILFVSRNYYLYLAIDETLSHLVNNREEYIKMQDIAVENENIIRILAPLKDFSMDDITILIVHKTLPLRIDRITRDLFPISPYQLSFLNYFIKSHEEIIEERREEMNIKRKIIENFLEKRKDISVSVTKASGSVFINLPILNTETFVEWLFTDYNRDKKTIFVAPAMHFHQDTYEDNGEILIDYRYLDSEMLEEGLEILSDALDLYLGLKKEDQ
jgi:aspartate aminotransferase